MSPSHHGPVSANTRVTVLARPRPVARSSTATRPRVNELLPRLLVATPAQPGSRRRSRCARPGAVLAAGETRQRERHEALAGCKVSAREHGGDRLSAHPPHSTLEPVHLIVGFRESVRGVGKLDSRPATDQELRLLASIPLSCANS